MRSKTDFYRLFFEQLARKGFDVKRSQSSDYIADIYYKNQLVAYFSKADTVIQNPFVAVKDKVMRLINDTAQNTAVKVGICRDCPYTDANEKLPNGSYKLAELWPARSITCSAMCSPPTAQPRIPGKCWRVRSFTTKSLPVRTLPSAAAWWTKRHCSARKN